eukprot:TRINITY_DN12222_c0_g1_i3.p1 TRINITY_DN12222_c0_g1~~TRINITY_DN12222_c0_g1_i3.p1  ORF type:complete len:245 (+),score=56.05 TRINITY_DN12222_c0_g1_i3:36-737(+)
MLTVHVDWTLGGIQTAVSVKGTDTVAGLLAKVANELNVRSRDLVMYHEGCEMSDMVQLVCKTEVGEGSTVEVRPSKGFEARMELEVLGVGPDVRKVVLAEGSSRSDCEMAHIVQLLIDSDNGYHYPASLLTAVERDYPETANVLCKACDVNDIDRKLEKTPLQLAAEKGHLTITRVLLSNGANPHKPGSYGITALQAAAESGHLEVVWELLDAGAEVDQQAEYGTVFAVPQFV